VITPEILRGFPFFVGLSEAELKSLSIIADEVSFQRGDYIFREDTSAHALYLLQDGWVDIEIRVEARTEHGELVTTLTVGDIFGWSALVEPYAYTASAVCASPVQAIEVNGTDLLALFEIDPKLCALIMKKTCQVIANRLRASRLQMTTLLAAY
jgi:CRP-like cAMP-binding protein